MLMFGVQGFSQKPSTVKGTLEMGTAMNSQLISTRYALNPAGDNQVILHLIPSKPFMLNAHVVDANGQEVIKLETENVEQRYVKSIDLSKLAAGNYFVELKDGNGQTHRIPFTK